MSSRIPRPTTTNLPRVRKALLVSLVATALLNLLATVSLLIFQLTKTRGYQKPVPAITAGAFVSLLLSLHFLFSTATSISRLHLPVRIELFVRSIAFELVCYAGMAAYFLVSVSDLHADTPGLLTSCGGYMICRMLTATAALTWLSFLAAMLNFVLIFASLFYLTVHRALPIVAKSAEVPFEGVDWRVYRNRGVRPRTGTIRHGGAPNRDRQREKSLHGGESTYGIRNDTDSVATYADTIHTSFSGGSIVDMGRFDWERGARDGERVIPVSPLVQIDMEPEEEDEEEEEEENAVEMKAVGGEKAEKEAEEEPGVAK
ncbi:hypothetical protein MNV49_002494 [Pseudohyphozyma bogoriensis]|nr:hypothetical protein MNV49_002494 [Pseudohyphozyma bogoriensis]